ncbi:MAG: phosphoribosylaminoimidazolesuccinocarboxamide synthase [Gemmatimonadetes bacterium]|nr:phosphoribosylaminoimidazolesuccinocarboxamide synthase [Gemmatimonadota bacterium]
MTAVYETNLPGLLHRGKVRDTYDLGDGRLLMVASDRISAFDVVLPTPVPDKGKILAQMSAFWFDLTKDVVPNHLIAMADDEAELAGVPRTGALAALPPELAPQAMVIRRAQRINVECVVRAYITGSAWAEYRRHGTVNNAPMPEGMVEADRFPEFLFTPSTKADVGHDQPLTRRQTDDLIGKALASKVEEASLRVFTRAHDYARSRGMILADTKFEFGLIDGELTLIDELLTPDSSRFWDAADWKPGKSPPAFDKQFVRDWLTRSGWNREPPAPALPDDIISKTRERYAEALRRLTGRTFRT